MTGWDVHVDLAVPLLTEKERQEMVVGAAWWLVFGAAIFLLIGDMYQIRLGVTCIARHMGSACDKQLTNNVAHCIT